MSRKTEKIYSVRTLRHNARKRTREIVQEIVDDSLSDSDSESEYECTSRTRVRVSATVSDDCNRYDGPAHVHRAACSSRSTNYGIINSGLNPSFGEGTEVSAANALSLSVCCGEMDVNVPDLELDLADAPASLHIETDSDDFHPNIDHESKSNDCESVTCTSVDGAAALLDIDLPIESNIGLDTDSAEWEDAPVTDADLNEIMVSDTFRFSSSSSDTDDDVDDSENNESSKRNQLRDWAVSSNIPQVHVSSLLKILQGSVPNLPKDARTLLSTNLVDYDVKEVAGGKYHHFGICSNLKAELAKNPNLIASNERSNGNGNTSSVMLQIFVDGLPISKSTPTQFWPILGRIHKPAFKVASEPFIIGLFLGDTKPSDANEFLREFVDEMKELEVNGLVCNGNIHVQVSISNFICDTPARAFIKCTKGHSGYYGCDKCTQRGHYVERRVTFPAVEVEQRTDQNFLNKENIEHHHKTSILSELSVGMITQFPIDYMHNVCLGIVRKLLIIWIRGPLATRIGRGNIDALSRKLLAFRAFMPCEFSRKGRSLNELDRWKATEFRTFLLYTGVVALKGILSDESYGIFTLLHVSMTILSSPLSVHYADYAKELLIVFAKYFGNLFGKEMLIYNVHAITHLADDVKRFGPVDNFSGFPFENYLAVLKRMLRKPHQQLQQVIRRIAEKNVTESSKCSSTFSEGNTGMDMGACKHKHSSGPLPPDLNQHSCSQFKTIVMEEFLVSIKRTGDSAVLIGDNICQVQNIITTGSQSYVVYKKFLSSSSFFEYPVESKKIGIHYVENLGRRLHLKLVTGIANKVVLLPFRLGYVSIPFNHKKSYM